MCGKHEKIQEYENCENEHDVRGLKSIVFAGFWTGPADEPFSALWFPHDGISPCPGAIALRVLADTGFAVQSC